MADRPKKCGDCLYFPPWPKTKQERMRRSWRFRGVNGEVTSGCRPCYLGSRLIVHPDAPACEHGEKREVSHAE